MLMDCVKMAELIIILFSLLVSSYESCRHVIIKYR